MEADSELACLLAVAGQLQHLAATCREDSGALPLELQKLSSAIRSSVRRLHGKLSAAGLADSSGCTPKDDFSATREAMRSTLCSIAVDKLAPLPPDSTPVHTSERDAAISTQLQDFAALLSKHDALLPAVQECFVPHPDPALCVELFIEDNGMLAAARPANPIDPEDLETPNPLPLGRSCFARRHGHRVVTWRGRVERQVHPGRGIGLGVVDAARVGDFPTNTGQIDEVRGLYSWNVIEPENPADTVFDIYGGGVADGQDYCEHHVTHTLSAGGGDFTLQLDLVQGAVTLQCPGSPERRTIAVPREGEYRLFTALDLVRECSIRLLSCHVLTDFD